MNTSSMSTRILGGLAAVLLVSLGVDAAQIAPAGNLAAQWPFDTVTGTTTPDLSGNGNTATLVGGPTAVAGLIGTAMQFNGTSHRLTVADSTSLDFASGSFSAAAWVRPGGTTAYHLMNKWNGAKGWLFELNATTNGVAAAGFIRAKMNDGTNNIDYSISGPVAANVWQHVAMTVDRGTNELKLFLNGAQKGTTQNISTLTGNLTTTSLLSLGTLPPAAGGYNGLMDEVVLYKRALTGAELTSLATMPPAAPTGLTSTPGVNQVALSWTAAAGATSYRVLRTRTPGGSAADPYVVVASNIAGLTTTDLTAAYPNTYYYVVQGVAGASPSANSNEVPGTPLPTPISATPNTGLTTNENGMTATFTITLNGVLETGNSVTFIVTSLDTTEGQVSGGGQPQANSITFTVNGPRALGYSLPITVHGINDVSVDPATLYQVSVSATSTQAFFSGVTIPNIHLTNNDNDIPGITIDRIAGLVTTEGGGTDTFSVVLNTQPSAAVTMALSSSNSLEGTVLPTSLTFTTTAGGPNGWNFPHVVTLTGVDDTVLDFTVGYTITTGTLSSSDPNYNGIKPPDVSASNTDDETIPPLPTVWGGCGLLGLEAALLLGLARLAGRGLRFISLFHRGGDWLGDLSRTFRLQREDTDGANAALLQDLKRRG